MNYRIVNRDNLWTAKANTLEEAQALATKHKNEWAEVGVNMSRVEVYYNPTATLEFTA